jgi:quinol monooxygenase YgiN
MTNTSVPGVTVLSTFEVNPSQQDQLIEILRAAADNVLRHQPGVIEVNILASEDGTRVVNYAHWRDVRDVEAMITNPAIREAMAAAWAISKPEPARYHLQGVYRPDDRPATDQDRQSVQPTA